LIDTCELEFTRAARKRNVLAVVGDSLRLVFEGIVGAQVAQLELMIDGPVKSYFQLK